MNKLMIIGNLTRDPEMRSVQGGYQVCDFTVAVNTGPLPEQMLTDEHADLVFELMADFCEAWDNFSTNNELI